MKTKLLIIVSFLILSACQKYEGEGGTSTIKGRVFVQKYNKNGTQVIEEYWAQEQNVYIVYGSDSIYSSKFDTDPNGWYNFKYLRKGKYTIFAYSDDTLNLNSSLQIPIKIEVEINEDFQEVEAPTITIAKL